MRQLRTSAAPAGREVIARLERLRDKLRTPAKTLADCRTLLQQVANASNELASTLGPNADDELKWWPRAVEQQCRTFLQDLDELASSAEIDLSGFRQPTHPYPRLHRSESTPLSATDSGNGNCGNASQRRHRAASEIAAKRISDLRQLAVRCRELADIDYGFLYDKDRHLLSIGYNVADRRLDSGFYDLLASEARLASFVAIAQGKLPQEHWFSLGRSLTNAGKRHGTALLERLDVRISDAAAGHADLRAHAAR